MKRYILFRTSEQLKKSEVKELLKERALSFFGEWGLSHLNISLVEFSEEEQIGIIRCDSKHFDEVLGFLALPDDKRLIALKSSGTLRALKNP